MASKILYLPRYPELEVKEKIGIPWQQDNQACLQTLKEAVNMY